MAVKKKIQKKTQKKRAKKAAKKSASGMPPIAEDAMMRRLQRNEGLIQKFETQLERLHWAMQKLEKQSNIDLYALHRHMTEIEKTIEREITKNGQQKNRYGLRPMWQRNSYLRGRGPNRKPTQQLSTSGDSESGSTLPNVHKQTRGVDEK